MSSGQGDPEHPEVHLDNIFMGEETGGKTLAIRVAKDLSSRALIERRLHEVVAVRDERGDIEDRQRTGAGGCG